MICEKNNSPSPPFCGPTAISYSETANQSQEEGLIAVNRTCVCADQDCRLAAAVTYCYRKNFYLSSSMASLLACTFMAGSPEEKKLAAAHSNGEDMSSASSGRSTVVRLG